jgi:hypothetical protein
MSGKQQIVGANGVQSPKQYNNYSELQLFTNHPKKIKIVDVICNMSDTKPWARTGNEKRTVKAPASK